MIKINLLSPFDKLDTKWEKINRSLIASSAKVIVVQLFFIILLVVSIEYLNIEKHRVDNELENVRLEKETREIEEMEKNIKNYENQLKYLSKAQENHVYWTVIIDAFANAVPSGVKISSFDVKRSKDKLKGKSTRTRGNSNVSGKSGDYKFRVDIAGTARTRSDLLDFEKNLKNSETFINLTSDGSNYVDRVNVNFRYTFYVNEKGLALK
jgi:Tfp pilus assembly protein PilN